MNLAKVQKYIFAVLAISTAQAATIAIDPAALSLSPADKALPNVCGVTTPGACPVCPPAPTCPTDPGTGNPGTGTGAWNGTCPGFNSTRVLFMSWVAPRRMFTKDFGGFGINDAVVVQFTTGSAPSTATNLPRLAAAEYQSAPSGRIATLSATPCDFGPQAAFGATIMGNSVTAIFAIDPGSGIGYYPVIPQNATWYLNMKNAPDASCRFASACDMFVDLVKAGGL